FPTNGAGVPLDHNQFSYGSGPTLGLDLGHSFSRRFEARLLLATNETNSGFDDRPDSTADSSRFQNLDDLRRSSADLRANLYLPSGPVVTVGTAVEQERERSFNVCQTSFGDCSTLPIDSARWNAAFYAQAVTDAGARISLTTGVRLEDDQRFVDMIDYNPSAAPGAPNYYNVAAAEANGLELGIRFTPPGRASVAGSYTYLHTEVTNPGFDPSSGALLAAGQPLTRRPKHSARLDAGYRLSERGAMSLAVTYVGDRQDQDFSTFPFPRLTLSSYTPINLAAPPGLRAPRGGAPGFAVSARVENVLDRPYEEVKNFPARGRTVLLGGRLAWAR